MLPLDAARFAAYLGVMAAFAVSPGPANLFVIAAGARAALAGVAGMNAASLIWIGAAALGLAALARTYPDEFRLLALAGAAYVAWLGLGALREAVRGSAAMIAAGQGSGAFGAAAALRGGFLVQITNPKALVFFGAVMPAFVDPARPAGPQLVWLGAATILFDVIAMSAYGLAAGALAQRLAAPRARRAFSAGVGVLLLAAALLILLRR